MHVVIVGAGEVGWYLAQKVRERGHDVVVVEQNEAIASAIGAELDVQVVVGSATLPSTLQAARIDRADLLAAVTQNDEVNLIASLLAKEAGVSQTVVRIQTEELRGESGSLLRATMRADVVMDPDADTADEIMELADAAGADEVYQMSGGDLLVLGCKIGEGSALAGSTLAEIGASFEPDWSFLFGALTHGDDETVIPRGNQRLEVGDHVRVLTSRKDKNKILELLGASHRRAKRVMVLGGGAVGSRVAERLQIEGADVVLVERDFDRARLLSERLPQITVVRGDIEDIDLLSEERITDKDLVIAATGDDAANVLACKFAATGRDTFTMVVIHRLSLHPLVKQLRINASLTPRIASTNAVLKHLTGTESVGTFLESNIEVDEIEIEVGSVADGAVVSKLHLPHSIVLGAVIRPGEPGRIIRGYTVLKAGDNVVVFARPESLPGLRKVFTA
ncbi:Trk system potassium transporter TrkA [uncultured Ilumatobacter sp.]|uniref:Trk system potassium transporter TrkA n=1 Tax=uncultured Ilumatobacter sp. TaxID=879968 RepID=UPI00374F531F